MVKVHKLGLMEQNTQDNGEVVKLRDTVLLHMPMAMYMLVNSKMIELTEKVCIHMLVDKLTMDTGLMIYNMDKE